MANQLEPVFMWKQGIYSGSVKVMHLPCFPKERKKLVFVNVAWPTHEKKQVKLMYLIPVYKYMYKL